MLEVARAKKRKEAVPQECKLKRSNLKQETSSLKQRSRMRSSLSRTVAKNIKLEEAQEQETWSWRTVADKLEERNSSSSAVQGEARCKLEEFKFKYSTRSQNKREKRCSMVHVRLADNLTSHSMHIVFYIPRPWTIKSLLLHRVHWFLGISCAHVLSLCLVAATVSKQQKNYTKQTTRSICLCMSVLLFWHKK